MWTLLRVWWCVLGVIAAVFLIPYVVTRVARRFGTDDVPIGKPIPRWTTADESLPRRAQQRRAKADALRAEIARIESSQPADRLRRVK